MPRSDIAVQQEAKYPEERRIDKDDRKQQSQLDRKQSKQTDKIAELHNKFTHTDYSEATGMTPEQRLAAISKDVNAIVHERVEREKEKEKAESAEWWAQEKAGEHAVGAEPKQSAEPIRAKNEAKPGQDKEGSNPVDNVSDIKAPATPKQDVTVAKGIRQAAPREEREEVGHRSVESDSSELSDHILSVSETSKDHKLRLPSFRARGSKLDEPSRSEIPDSLRSTEAVAPADGVNHYLQQKGTNHRSSWKSKNMSAERAALDATLAERREYLAAVGPASDDIGNHESASDAGRPEFKLTSSVPHGSVKRDEQRSSSAWNITAGVTENDDPTRTHTRPGQDRKQELGKITERDAQPWKATQQALKEDGHSGSFFQSRAGRTGSSSMPSQTETIVVERPAVSVTRTEPVARPGVVADIKHAVVEAKDSVVHAAQVTKHKIADAGHAVKETVKEKIEIAKDKAEDALEVVEDKLIAVKDKAGDAVEVVEEKIVAAKDRVEDAAESGWEATKDAVVSVKTKIVRTERDLEDKAERGWDATKSKAGELKRDTERGWENTKLRAESGWENAKDRMEAGWDSAKDRAEVTKLKTERVIVDSKDEFTTKLRGARRDVRDNIGVMEREIELRDAQLRREADRTGREIKLKADEAKLRVEHGWDRTKERADDLTHDAKIKAGEMKRSAEREVHSLKATAEGALHRTEEDVKSLGNKVREGLHWLNPLSHIGNKEKEVDVDSSPAGVHIRSHATTAERLPRHATPGTFTAPASLARQTPSSSIDVPNSLRGLEDSEPLPKSQGLSLRVPSLSSRRSVDREETLPQEAVQPLQHPNSLQGDIIEPVSLPPRATQQTKRGWLASLFGGRDSPREEAPVDLTRQDKLNASARDFWDLKAQEGHPTTPSSPIGARSASPVGGRSMTPVAYSPSPSSPMMRSPMASESSGSSRLGAGMHEWGVMTDPLFEELLPSIME